MDTSQLTQLNVLVPPDLAQTLGYDGDARFVGFYWGAGDELWTNDGRSEGTYGDWHAWDAFIYHRRITPVLVPYHFGSSDQDAEHYLIVDTRANDLYVASVKVARQFLDTQHSPLPRLTSETPIDDLRDILARAMSSISMPTVDEIQACMGVAATRIAAMVRWLDEQPNDAQRIAEAGVQP